MSTDVLVIGSGPAGLSAAVNVRARGRSVLVVSNPMKENPLWRAEKVNNYLGLPNLSGAELLQTLYQHAKDMGVEFREGRVLNAISMGSDWFVSIGTDMENAKALVLAGGVARAKKFHGEAEFLGKGVSYCATCDGMLYREKPVAVLGYSESAKEEAEFLTSIGCSVTYFDHPKDCVIEGENTVSSVTCGGERVEVACVFILRPAIAPTDMLSGIAVDNGYIIVNRKMETNLSGVFAAGDCTGTPLQASKAAGEGLIAGQSAAAYVAQLLKNAQNKSL